MKKDLMDGIEYDVMQPKEGDIVRVNLHNVNLYGNTSRMYVMFIYPSADKIQDKYCSIVFDCKRYVGYMGKIACGPITIHKNDNPVFVKPSIHDMFEFSQKLKEDGVIYNRKKKEIIKIKKNESN